LQPTLKQFRVLSRSTIEGIAVIEEVFDSTVVQCPFQRYNELRAASPAVQVPDERSDIFVVTGYEDCVRVLGDPVTFSSKIGPGLRQRPSSAARAILDRGPKLVRTLLTNDPPGHTRFRRLVSSSFTPRRLAVLKPVVDELIGTLIDAMQNLEKVDFVESFAQPLPLLVIARFLGVPDSELPTFRRWSDDAAEVLGGKLDEARQVEIAISLVELLEYFATQAELRRSRPQDDFLTALTEMDNHSLSTEEIVAIAYVVLVAGNETTVNLLSGAMLLLLQNPGEFERVRGDRSLVPLLVEEALRLQSPIQGFPRLAAVDTEVAGVPIPAGSQVLLMIGAANRDPAQFDAPDFLDLHTRRSPGHIAFGHGPHFCVGAALSRLEAEIAFNQLLDRFSAIALRDPGFKPRYADNLMVRTLTSLPVRLTT
jgi:cytochrome P450